MKVQTLKRSFRLAACGSLVALANVLSAQSLTTPANNAISLRAPQPDQRGRIQGTVFDSLMMKPMARASVMLMGTGRSTVTDDRGRFSFDTVVVGEHEVGFSAAAFDSVGLGVMGAAVTVAANQAVRVAVATPSFRTLWSNRCKTQNTFGTDSTIVWGSVRDAASDSLLPGIVTTFTFFDLRPKRTTSLIVDEIHYNALTDINGNYFACGLPSDVVLSAQAMSPKAASGRIEYAIGLRRVYYADFLVSPDMIVPDTVLMLTRQDSLDAARPRGRAGVRGMVIDEKGKPLANALVDIADLDSAVRTGADGAFRVSDLPAGTHTLHVRRVGSAPVTQLLHLRPEVITEATVHMSDIPTLAAVNVRSAKFKSVDRIGYETRRRFGYGYALDGAALRGRRDVYGALQNFPGMTVTPASFGVKAAMKSGGSGGGYCLPSAFLNGILTDITVASSMPIEEYRAIEVYNRPVQIPAEFYRFSSCGAILFWTKNARW